jgi:hypothetical protein
MATMSTPVTQLPGNISNDVINQNITQLEDPVIADVINEMEREVQQQRPPQAPPQQYMQPQAPPQQYMQQPQQQYRQPPQVQHSFQQQYPVQYPQPSGFFGNQYASWVNTPHAQRAILAAIIAAFIFYPFETGVIYEKIPFLSNMHEHDRLIRTFFLAVVLYVLLLKVNI